MSAIGSNNGNFGYQGNWLSNTPLPSSVVTHLPDAHLNFSDRMRMGQFLEALRPIDKSLASREKILVSTLRFFLQAFNRILDRPLILKAVEDLIKSSPFINQLTVIYYGCFRKHYPYELLIHLFQLDNVAGFIMELPEGPEFFHKIISKLKQENDDLIFNCFNIFCEATLKYVNDEEINEERKKSIIDFSKHRILSYFYQNKVKVPVEIISILQAIKKKAKYSIKFCLMIQQLEGLAPSPVAPLSAFPPSAFSSSAVTPVRPAPVVPISKFLKKDPQQAAAQLVTELIHLWTKNGEALSELMAFRKGIRMFDLSNREANTSMESTLTLLHSFYIKNSIPGQEDVCNLILRNILWYSRLCFEKGAYAAQHLIGKEAFYKIVTEQLDEDYSRVTALFKKEDDLDVSPGVLKQISDLLVSGTIKELSFRLNRGDLLRERPVSQPLVLLSGCFIYREGISIKLYPLSFQMDEGGINALKKDDGSVAKILKSLDISGESIQESELELLLSFARDNKDFRLLMCPPSARFSKPQQMRPQEKDRKIEAEAAKEEDELEEGGGGRESLLNTTPSLRKSKKKGTKREKIEEAEEEEFNNKKLRITNRTSAELIDSEEDASSEEGMSIGYEEEQKGEASSLLSASAFPTSSSQALLDNENPWDQYSQQALNILSKRIEHSKRAYEDDLELSNTISWVRGHPTKTYNWINPLLPYQIKIVRDILKNGGGLCAAGQGCGKTYMALEHMLQSFIAHTKQSVTKGVAQPFSALLVVPKTLLSQWHSEVLKVLFNARIKHYESLIAFSDISQAEFNLLAKNLDSLLEMQNRQKKLSIEKKKDVKLIDGRIAHVKDLISRVANKWPELLYKNITNSPGLEKRMESWFVAIIAPYSNRKEVKDCGFSVLGYKIELDVKKFVSAVLAREDIEKNFDVLLRNSNLSFPTYRKKLIDFLAITFPNLTASSSSTSFADRPVRSEFKNSLWHEDMYENALVHEAVKSVSEVQFRGKQLNVLITTTSALMKKDKMPKLSFEAIYIDEAHLLVDEISDGATKKTSECLKQYLKQFPKAHKVELTATPFVNSAKDLFFLLSHVDSHGNNYDKMSQILMARIKKIGDRTRLIMNKLKIQDPQEIDENLINKYINEFLNAFTAIELAKKVIQENIYVKKLTDPDVRAEWAGKEGIDRTPIIQETELIFKSPEVPENIKNMGNFSQKPALCDFYFHPRLNQFIDSSASDSAITEQIMKMSEEKLDEFITSSPFLVKFIRGKELEHAINKKTVYSYEHHVHGLVVAALVKRIYNNVPGLEVVLLNGKTNTVNRGLIIENFRVKTTPTFLCMQQSISAGIDLVSGTDLFMSRRGYNDVTFAQMKCRILRPGPVGVIKRIHIFVSDALEEEFMEQYCVAKGNERTYFFSSLDSLSDESIQDNMKLFLKYLVSKNVRHSLKTTRQEWQQIKGNSEEAESYLNKFLKNIDLRDVKSRLKKILESVKTKIFTEINEEGDEKQELAEVSLGLGSMLPGNRIPQSSSATSLISPIAFSSSSNPSPSPFPLTFLSSPSLASTSSSSSSSQRREDSGSSSDSLLIIPSKILKLSTSQRMALLPIISRHNSSFSEVIVIAHRYFSLEKTKRMGHARQYHYVAEENWGKMWINPDRAIVEFMEGDSNNRIIGANLKLWQSFLNSSEGRVPTNAHQVQINVYDQINSELKICLELSGTNLRSPSAINLLRSKIDGKERFDLLVSVDYLKKST